MFDATRSVPHASNSPKLLTAERSEDLGQVGRTDSETYSACHVLGEAVFLPPNVQAGREASEATAKE